MAPREVTTGLLLQMVEQNEEKQDAAHQRLRRDLTEGFNDMGQELDALRLDQRADHETLLRQQVTRERRKELSATRVVIVAALIGGGFRLIDVVINAVVALR